MTACLWAGLGGFTGAASRYFFSTVFPQGIFPLTTLFINVTGSFFIGLIIGITTQKNLPEPFILFTKTGLCGGFTTFSTFSAETLLLLEKEEWAKAGFYVIISVVACITGVWLGKFTATAIMK